MRRYTESERRRMVRAFERSGLSAAEFCRRRGVSAVSLAQWRRRHAGVEYSGKVTESSWLPVVVTDPENFRPAAPHCGYVLSLGGCRLEVPAGFAPSEVRQLWQLLTAAAADGALSLYVMNVSPATKVHLLSGATDMRLGYDGLFALAKGLLQADPLSGHLFGFCNKSRNRLKILYWDGSGLWICAKRLDRGRYAWPQPEPAPAGKNPERRVLMTQAELTLLLHGIDLAATRRRRWHRVENVPAPA